ncbi:uncharacterized protein LOC126903015 isoform X5 [Daktulosphaira vitifoliae]|uniref:uncharacterized protein LOC126903015 isoform X5 n=1 Tax=Daktulosphaira vitifoliae TaxID=58002 RepID=UPI0021AA9F9C|nr:uncharacterized protein LOC126903015 isoform X5 [Daktulosphaira vitifoliae]
MQRTESSETYRIRGNGTSEAARRRRRVVTKPAPRRHVHHVKLPPASLCMSFINHTCPDGYMGQRCEYKNLDGSYTTTRRQVMLESASIASGVSVAVLLVFIICTTFYIRSKRQRKLKMNATDISMVDGTWGDMERRPFAYRPKHTIVTIPLKTVITESVTRPVDGPEGSSRQEPLIV